MTAAATHAPRSNVAPWPRRRLSHAKRRARELAVRRDRERVAVRRRLAARHLRGSGLEIGALHMPLQVPRGVDVRFVDRLTVPELRRHYPELRDYDLVEPDIIDDGETVASVPDGAADFVIANHLIEHCQDPIGTLASHLRVLRRGGVLYMAVPDCRYTFDRDRPVTPLEHVVRDHLEGPAWSRRGHFEEWARLVDHVPEELVAARADELERADYSIHFHVWTASDFVELLLHCRGQLELPLELDSLERNDHEFIVIARRTR